MKDIDIAGYDVVSAPGADCIQSIARTLDDNRRDCAWLACLNPHSYAVARKNGAFRHALDTAEWLVPDGVGVVLAAWMLRRPLCGRITGNDIFDGVMSALDARGGSVFFLGSSEETLALIAAKLRYDYPNVRLAGTYAPPYKVEFTQTENRTMVNAVATSGADVLWVGMTAPKQEMWIARHRDQLPVVFAGAIGAVFDFYAGQVKRSHPVFRKTGLEWLPRLLRQPKRLWRRMFVSAPVFLWDILCHRLRRT